jgi:tetratricopeptide (TPR) repeat protein
MMSGATEPAGTVEQALAHASQLLERSPELAAEQAAEILKVAPRDARALLLLGLAQGALGQGETAVAALRRAVLLAPGLGDAWRTLADHLTAMGDTAGADAAFARYIQCSTRDPRLLRPAAALCENRIAEAEALLRAHLKAFPTDVPAIRMLAEVAARLGRYEDAENLLRRCLELAPGFRPARQNLAAVLYRHDKPAEALPEVEQLLAAEPRNPSHRTLKAAVLGRVGEYDQAIELYRAVLAEYPNQPKVWMSAGHALKTAGRQDEGVAAYRRCIELAPGLGEAWWSLANLKTVKFSAADMDAMRVQLARADIGQEDRFHLHFALGKALEDAGDYVASFEEYAEGNRLRRTMIGYSADENAAHVRRSRQLFTREFFAARAGHGAPAPDPVFIVGLPRSGSTLLEQVLSSHSQVEGTMELPDMVALARELGGRRRAGEPSRYPQVLAALGAGELRALGERYLERTRIQRKTGAPFFIDKLPNNFAHVGLIHLVLPNARIIDARRHPLACCFSGFKQHFARGQSFSYSLEDIGRYYRDYVELMAHFDAVLPGRVHRVFYEAMVDDTESEVRRLLDYCGLPFEPQCLEFHRNVRAVRTASSEQVRQPIFREGLDQWRHFDAWLAPLKGVLGPVLDAYPGVPDFGIRY